MRIHTAPKQSTERKVIHTLLVICLALGFISITVVYLPQRLRNAGARNIQSEPPRPSLSSVLPITPATEDAPATQSAPQGPIFKFIPEDQPAKPMAYQAESVTSNMSDESGESLETQLVSELDSALYSERPRQVRHRTSSLVDGSAQRTSSTEGRWWETPRGLDTDVQFWKDIYTKYSTSQVVLHDPDYLNIIYDVVDLSDIDDNPLLDMGQKQKLRQQRVGAAREQYEAMLGRLAKNRDVALRTRLGKKISHLYATVDEEEKFKNAHERGVRAQTGQRDRFIQALRTSGQYLGEMELIFKSYGLPRELTRLVFVESMFQIRARSKAGAAGLWQFMPSTGEKYLRINRIIDERLDPIIATHAAAKLLKHNYEALGTWPLAINAYNAGRGRLQQAVNRLGTTDIGTIILNFEHPAYGFASRNFFLEFVAAREITDNAEHYFGRIDYDPPLSYDVMELPFHISLPEVARMADIQLDDLVTLNPAFEDRVFSGSMLVPMGSTLRVPENTGRQFLTLAQRARKTNRAPLEHIVARGESLGQIANMYGVDPSRIREANPGIKRKLRHGQRLYIPFD